MTAQLALDLAPLVVPDHEPEASLPDRYAAFVASNPHVLDTFEALTDQWLSAGHERVGIKAVAEKARWESGLRMPGEAWAINNSYVAFIARDLIARRPEWAKAISTRQQKAAA